MGPWLRLCTPNTVGPGLTPDWGTTSHMPQLKVRKTERKKEEKEERNGSAARPLDPLNRLLSAVTSYINRHRNRREG